jgi:hypothetical protein
MRVRARDGREKEEEWGKARWQGEEDRKAKSRQATGQEEEQRREKEGKK